MMMVTRMMMIMTKSVVEKVMIICMMVVVLLLSFGCHKTVYEKWTYEEAEYITTWAHYIQLMCNNGKVAQMYFFNSLTTG